MKDIPNIENILNSIVNLLSIIETKLSRIEAKMNDDKDKKEVING
jgi:hypothetical protein|tara:strand:+ start:293 stop:427 length:135 start_codon:yes stop_codon:yes gene_type:complete